MSGLPCERAGSKQGSLFGQVAGTPGMGLAASPTACASQQDQLGLGPVAEFAAPALLAVVESPLWRWATWMWGVDWHHGKPFSGTPLRPLLSQVRSHHCWPKTSPSPPVVELHAWPHRPPSGHPGSEIVSGKGTRLSCPGCLSRTEELETRERTH